MVCVARVSASGTKRKLEKLSDQNCQLYASLYRGGKKGKKRGSAFARELGWEEAGDGKLEVERNISQMDRLALMLKDSPVEKVVRE